MSTRPETLCPSAQPDWEGARVIGVVGGTPERPETAYLDQARLAGLDPERGLTVVGFAVLGAPDIDAAVNEVFAERLIHLLSLQMSWIDPAAGVVAGTGAYYAIVPIGSQSAHELLPGRLQAVHAQLQRLDLDAYIAVGRRVTTLAELPAVVATVDDQLLVLRRHGYGPPPVHYVGKTGTFVLLGAFPVLLLAEAVPAAHSVAAPIGWGLAWWALGLYWAAAVLYLAQARALLRADRTPDSRGAVAG